MEKDDFELAARNAAKLFKWLDRKMSVPEGVEMMVVALAITIKNLAEQQEDTDMDDLIDTIADLIREAVVTLQEIPADERA